MAEIEGMITKFSKKIFTKTSEYCVFFFKFRFFFNFRKSCKNEFSSHIKCLIRGIFAKFLRTISTVCNAMFFDIELLLEHHTALTFKCITDWVKKF